MKAESRAIFQRCAELAFKSRGAVSYQSAMMMCFAEQQIVNDVAEKHFENLSKANAMAVFI